MAATGGRYGGARDHLRRIGVAAACVAWLLTASPGPASEENGEPGHSGAELMDLSVQELLDVNVEEVRGASLRKQLIADAPASVTIVDSDEIKKYGYRTLADILASVPGMFIGYDRNYTTAGIRGFERPSDFNSRILLLLDGHRLNDGIFTGAAIGTDSILDVDLIDRVEVIRGPASALYGTSAFFGVVNVVSRGPEQIGGVEVSTSAASLGTYQGRLSYGHRFDSGVGVVASGTFLDSQGHDDLYYPEFDDPSTNFGVAENLDGDRAGRFFAAVTYTDLTVTGAYDLRDKDVPTASFGAIFDDPRYQTRDAQGFADVRWEHEFAGSVTALARAYYDHYDTRGRYPYDVAAPGDPPDAVLNVDRAVGESVGIETRLTKQFSGGHRVAAGLEYRNDLRQNQRNFDVDPRVSYLDDKRDGDLWSPFVQADIALPYHFSLSLAVRYDRYTTFGSTTNPRVALIYRPWQRTAIKAIYGTAFRAPSAFELYYDDGDVTAKANPKLDPETVEHFQLVLEQGLTRNIKTSLSGFSYHIDDLISQTVDPADGLQVFENIEEVDTLGLEWTLEARFDNGARGRVSYSFQDADDATSNKHLSNSPAHLAKLNAIYPLWRDLVFGGFELQYVSPVDTLSASTVEGYFLTNFTLFTQQLLKDLEVSASLYNLFAENYAVAGGFEHVQEAIPQDGRIFRLKVTYRF